MLQEPVTWHGMLREFLARCAHAWPGEQGDCLREASLLFQFARSTPPQPVAPDLERMIAAGAYANAAAALLDADARYSLSRALDGSALAHVTLAGGTEASARARVPALALLTANAKAMLLRMQCGGEAGAAGSAHPGTRDGKGTGAKCPLTIDLEPRLNDGG